MIRTSKGHLQVDILYIMKYTDQTRKGDLASYRLLLKVWSLHIIDLKIKIEDKIIILKLH